MASKRKKKTPQPLTGENHVGAEQHPGLSDEDLARSRQMEERIDMAEKQGKRPRKLTAEELVRIMVADEKLVRETNEAFDRFQAGERGVVVSADDIKAWLDDPTRPRPV